MVKKRQTASKLKVMTVFENSSSAMSHDLIESELQGEMDRVTIYRILKSFEEDGVIHRIQGENGKSYFAKCTDCSHKHSHNHLHFQCTQCETIECLTQRIEIPIPSGYQIQSLQLTATGICAKCAS